MSDCDCDECRELRAEYERGLKDAAPKPINLKELRRLLEASTPGPWYAYPSLTSDAGYPPHIESDDGHVGTLSTFSDCAQGQQDATLIAALRNAAPALLAVVEAAVALTALRKEYDDELDTLRRLCEPLQTYEEEE